ncbi:MAG TPA: hypothetical protein VFI22_13735, partial [Thermomicrobiales bacterium]|nr:hypothetical protein [Thermomicrobiales bacterium]
MPPPLAIPARRVSAGAMRFTRPALLTLLGLVVVLLAFGGRPRVVQAQTPQAASPERCRVGVFLIDLYDLDYAANSFTADFWLWSVCPTAAIRPLDTLEFINANAVT